MLLIGVKYRAVGGKVKVSGGGCVDRRPGFPFGCRVGTFTGFSPNKKGWLCFDLTKGRKAVMNGGIYKALPGQEVME